MRWAVALAFAAVGFSPQPPEAKWPAGPGAEIVQTKCAICHSAGLIQSQRLTAGQWNKEVDKMVGWGAPLEPAEKAILAGYLARHFGPDRPIGAPPRLDFTGN